MVRTGFVLVVLGFVVGACGGSAPAGLIASGGPPLGSTGDDDGGTAAGDAGGGGTVMEGGPGVGDASTHPTPQPDAGAGSDAGSPCYSEPYDPHATIADLAAAYSAGNWLATAIETMHRRYPTGYFVLGAEKSDPQLPQLVDASSWTALMSSLLTVLDAETTGWDFANADATTHPFVVTDALHITVPQLTTWQRGEIATYITDAATQTYDQIELQGQEATYDAIFLFDALDSACNGLAAVTAVGDQITSGISARDGVAARVYYMELYLRAGRTGHAAAYAAMKADPGWQKLVRYEWARAHFWDVQSTPNANLQIAVSPIKAHVDDAASLSEIALFTGESPDAVACHP